MELDIRDNEELHEIYFTTDGDPGSFYVAVNLDHPSADEIRADLPQWIRQTVRALVLAGREHPDHWEGLGWNWGDASTLGEDETAPDGFRFIWPPEPLDRGWYNHPTR